MGKTNKHPVSFRMTNTARHLLAVLAKYFGISKTAIVEIAIREKASRHNLTDDAQFLPMPKKSSLPDSSNLREGGASDHQT